MSKAMKISFYPVNNFLKAGIAMAIIVAALFVFKWITGYQEVTFVDNYDNCSVFVKMENDTFRSQNRSHKKRYYYVYITNAEHNIDLKYVSSRSYYEGFKKYTGRHDVKLSFFAKENGEIFPVYQLNCDEREAEKQLRGIDRPMGWYFIYTAGGFWSFILILIGLKVNSKPKNYIFAPAASAPQMEQQYMADESDRFTAQDKYGKYNDHKFK